MGIENRTFGAGYLLLGHVFLPYPGNNKDKDSQEGEDYRTRIIKQCYRKKAVSILFNNGTIANNCPVSLSCIKDIQFPEKFGEVGSPVLIFMEPVHKKPLVICTYGMDDEVYFLGEGDQKLGTTFGNALAEVGVKSKSGEIFMTVDSSNADEGNVYINISNAHNKGKLNIRVLGESVIHTLNNCTIESSTNVNVNVKDVEKNITTSVNVSKNGVKVTRGDSGLKKTLQDLISKVEGLLIVTPSGQGTVDPSSVQSLEDIKKDLDNYLED